MNKDYYERNKDKINLKRREKRLERTKEQIEDDRRKKHEYYMRNREKFCKLNKEHRERNSEKYKEYGRVSYHKRKNDPDNAVKALLKNAKQRASQKGVEFSLTSKDIVLPSVCPIMKVPFNKDTRRYSYSLDRIDPNKGYTPDNIWVISQIANCMKWDSTQDERVLFATWVLKGEGGKKP